MKKINMVRLVVSVAIGLLLITVPGFTLAANQIKAPTANPVSAVPVHPTQVTLPQPQQGPPAQGGPNGSTHKVAWPRPQSSGPDNHIGFLSGPTAGDPLDIALDYIRRNKRTLGLSEADLADFVVKDRYVSQHNGVTHIYLRQRLDGIEVFNADININIDRQGRVINLGNQFVSNLSASVNAATPSLAAIEAVNRASQHLGLTITEPLAPRRTVGGPAKEVVLSGGGISLDDIPVKLMYLPQRPGVVRLGWELVIRLKNGLNWWNISVDAVTGDVISQNDWIANDTYQVFALPKEHPNDGPRTLVINPADPTASPFGWHDTDGLPGAEFVDTRGNNVFAQDDLDANNSGGSRPSGGDGLVFSQTLDLSLAPSTYLSAAITNLFYWNNTLHDIHYQYGFDEASGNFQQNNYGHGGFAGDPVQADAQDGSGTNNANFAAPPDAFDPRMQMFVWTFTTPNRDSDLDNGVIIHEYGHGVSNRLTGGPSNANCLFNAEQMGEGWSDWWALALTAVVTDTGPTPRGLGTYLLGQPPTGPGIRDFRYSTDMTVNPQTYNSIKTATSPHDVGEVWAAMLWEMYWNLVDRYGFDPDFYHGNGGNNLAMQLVMDGLKLQPCSPSFVDGRNAILSADMVNNGGANQCPIWEAFAKRGLGFSAEAGNNFSVVDGTEAFDLPLQCSGNLVLTKSGLPSPAQAGQVLSYTLVAGNYTTRTLTGVTLSDTIPLSASYIPGSASNGGSESGGVVQWNIGSMAPDTVATRTFQVMVDANFPDPTALFFDDMEGGGGNWTATGLWHLEADSDPCGQSFSPTTSWYYGQSPGCTYNTGSSSNSGRLTSAAPIFVPASLDQVTLTFQSWEDTEGLTGYDTRQVLISTDGISFTQIFNSTNEDANWYKVELDLSNYAGQNIWLRFEFNTVDGFFNNFPGWYVDDVRITGQPGLPNTASVASNEGDANSATINTPVIKTASLGYSPAQIEQTMPLSQIITNTLTLSNTGALPLSFSLADKSIPGCALLNFNHNFELGDFTGWTTIDDSGTWLINEGTYPRIIDGATTPPLQGSFSALVDQLGPGTNILYQDVTLPAELPGAVLLRWIDQWQNHATTFANNQEFRVNLYGPAGAPFLGELFSTKPGDPPLSGPTPHEVNVTSLVAPYAGQSVRLQ
ncbi:MAG: M36 family metallopeptidase, partial [Chloroflexi bacterium]|nr:M36 family metallopeptidase [Chloroflexota bacterium]